MDFSNVWPYLKKVLPYLVVLAIGVAIGWEMKPDQYKVEEKIVEKDKIVEKMVIDEALVKAEVDKRVKEIQSKMKVRVVTVWAEKPDGTKTTTKTEEAETETKTKEDETKTTNTTETKKEVVEKVVYRDVETVKVITPVEPQWMVGLAVGFAPRFDNLGNSPLMLQVQARRHILGPFWLGLQVQAGSPVTVFNVTNAAAFVTGDALF